jgi:hypothetical protein
MVVYVYGYVKNLILWPIFRTFSRIFSPKKEKVLHQPFLIHLEGSPGLAVFRDIINSKLSLANYTWIPYNLLPVSCGDIGFLQKHRSSIGM